MKIWTRQKDGSYTASGEEPKTRRVRLVILRGDGSQQSCLYARGYAVQMMEDAMRRGQVRAACYRMEPVEDAPLDEATEKRLAALRERKKAERWREPAGTRSEAAARAWATRRARREGKR